MKGSTIGMLVGGGAGIIGVGLLASAIHDIHANKPAPGQATPTPTIPTAAQRAKELTGGALLFTGVGIFLGSVVSRLAGKPDHHTHHAALSAGENADAQDENDEDDEERTSDVQSLLFRRNLGWTEAKAKRWSKTHGYAYGDLDVTADLIHLRQYEPDEFKRFATKSFGKGISARIGFR